MSTWQTVHLGVFLLWFCPFGSLSIWHSVHIGLRLQEGLSNLVWLTCYYLYLWVGPTGCLSTCILSTLESGYMTFSPRRIVPTIGSVNPGFCSRLVLSTWDFVRPGCLFTWNLSSWKFGNMTFRPLLCVPTNVPVNSGFCSHLGLSTRDNVHKGLFLFEIM